MGLEIGVIVAALSSLFGFTKLINEKNKIDLDRAKVMSEGLVTTQVDARPNNNLGSVGLAAAGVIGATAGAVLFARRRAITRQQHQLRPISRFFNWFRVAQRPPTRTEQLIDRFQALRNRRIQPKRVSIFAPFKALFRRKDR